MLIFCQVCGKTQGWEDHVCDHKDIEEYVKKLEYNARISECKVYGIESAVSMLLSSLPSLEGDTVVVETEWLRKLWKASGCQWKDSETADNFLSKWIVTHRVLCEAFDVFRSRKNETLLQKLTALKVYCEEAKINLGYEDSVLDMSPEDLIKEINGSN